MTADDVLSAATPHLEAAAESIAEMERLRRACYAAQRARDLAIRNAYRAGMKPPAIARHLGISASLARLAAIPHWERDPGA